jgi:glycosyltransferase involved in cell wall biosynthesis
MTNNILSYVLVTAARNEDAYIEKTIQSVISQSILPRRWVIVSDGSTDRTDEIVAKYTAKYDFIHFIKVDANSKRNFASQVKAFNLGYEQVKNIGYDFIGNLDADVSFESDYYENIISKFAQNPKLGVAGGNVFDKHGNKFKRQFISKSVNVCGPIQMFRRDCFEEIGGYIPIENGPLDIIADLKARMYGWEVKSFHDIKVFHHRRTGTERRSILSYRLHQGVMEYSFGSHPIFEVAKCFLRTIEKPYIIGSIFRMGGYFWAFLRRVKRVIPNDVVKYLRQEQLCRLMQVLVNKRSA